jgi:beta-lactamase superfamily II metal-dependent hydrolase
VAGEISWRLLAPTHEQLDEALAASKPNHGSLVLRVDVGGATVLLPGEADAASWSLMHEAGCDLGAEVLLVPHHGAAMGWAGVVTGTRPDRYIR